MEALQQKDVKRAWTLLVKNNPFPSVAGRVCHHPCEVSCNRSYLDEQISICDLERFVGDQALEHGWSFPEVTKQSDKKVAIIGGGPAGLSAAYFLAGSGVQVTLFEKEEDLGGVLSYGIPEYRLPKDILEGEIQRVLELGIIVKTEHPVNLKRDLEKLEDQFDAVFAAPGVNVSKKLPLTGSEGEEILSAAQFLYEVNKKSAPSLGKRAVIIGGGSAAMDVARSAKRLGCEVTVLSLEDKNQLPADPEEVKEAIEEEILFRFGSLVNQVSGVDGTLRLSCSKVNFVPAAEGSSPEIEVLDGTEFHLETDSLITAIGQDPDISKLPGNLVDAKGLIQVNNRFQTKREKLFAAGDITTEERFVTNAIGAGKNAAHAILKYLMPKISLPEKLETPVVPFEEINTFYHPKQKRSSSDVLPAKQRKTHFQEVKTMLGDPDAFTEAERCFNCGTCIQCDNCFLFCPDMAIVKKSGEYIKYDILTRYCKGCGLCVTECPTGSMSLIEEAQ